MSSGPVGLDTREYGYAVRWYQIPIGNVATYSASTVNRWLVTRVRFWADPSHAASFGLRRKVDMWPIAPGGCVELEPNGAFREDVFIAGEGSLLQVEYWFQAIPDPNPVVVIFTVEP